MNRSLVLIFDFLNEISIKDDVEVFWCDACIVFTGVHNLCAGMELRFIILSSAFSRCTKAK